MTWHEGSLIISIAFLVSAVIDDLFFKKFHNKLFIILCITGFVWTYMSPNTSFGFASLGLLAGGLLMLPLTLIGAIGAGDMKFMMSFGILTGPLGITNVFILSLIWGSIIGLLKVFLSGGLSQFYENLKLMKVGAKPTSTAKIPFTVPIAFGWVMLMTMGGPLS